MLMFCILLLDPTGKAAGGSTETCREKKKLLILCLGSGGAEPDHTRVCSNHFVKLASCWFVYVTLQIIYALHVNNATLQTHAFTF